MKNKEFISEEYRKACRYCERGRLSFDGQFVLCVKRGIMPPEDCCKKYVYDPLKRTPLKPKAQTVSYAAEDFSL